MKIGLIIQAHDKDIELNFKRAKELGFQSCQISGYFYEDGVDIKSLAEEIKGYSEKYDIEISAVIAGWSGPRVWNFCEGPMTLGIVPAAYRQKRTEEILLTVDFANLVGSPDVNTHIGFIPEDLNSHTYNEVVSAVKFICKYAKTKNINFCMETGQETPITLLRLIEDTGAENIGINLDPANLLMYGKANPIDAVGILAKYIKGVHGKDGEYPTNPRELGREMAMGEGKVNFPVFVSKLKEIGYDGSITIEREISGEQQEKDIIAARDILKSCI